MHFLQFFCTAIFAVAQVYLQKEGGNHVHNLQQKPAAADSSGPAGNPFGEIAKGLVEEAKKLLAPFTEVALKRLQNEVFGNSSARGTRSTDVLLFNPSSKTFEIVYNKCVHGGWSTGMFPEDVVPANSSSVYGVESHGLMSGIACLVKYRTLDEKSELNFWVTNEYAGKNLAGWNCTDDLRVSNIVGTGNYNNVRFIIKDKK